MSNLQVRDFPKDLHEKLRVSAKYEHRSVSQQTIIAVEAYLASRAGQSTPNNRTTVEGHSGAQATTQFAGEEGQGYLKKRKQVLERIRATPKPSFTFTSEDIVEVLHEGRDERDDRFRL